MKPDAHMRMIIRAYCMSQQPQDAARARELCAQYGVDADAVRAETDAAARAWLNDRLARQMTEGVPCRRQGKKDAA